MWYLSETLVTVIQKNLVDSAIQRREKLVRAFPFFKLNFTGMDGIRQRSQYLIL